MKTNDESRRTRALSPLWVCALLAGCLVTNELDFEPNRNRAQVLRESPDLISRAKSKGDPDCNLQTNTTSMKFDAIFYDEDVDQPLFVNLFLNGRRIGDPRQIDPSADGSPRHVLSNFICIAVADLSQPCNRVQLFVSDNYNDLAGQSANTTNNINVETLDWLVAPPPSDTLGGPGMPEAQPSDCINESDGGV